LPFYLAALARARNAARSSSPDFDAVDGGKFVWIEMRLI
jgi:hypothetical protein